MATSEPGQQWPPPNTATARELMRERLIDLFAQNVAGEDDLAELRAVNNALYEDWSGVDRVLRTLENPDDAKIRKTAADARARYSNLAQKLGELALSENRPLLANFLSEKLVQGAAKGQLLNEELFTHGTLVVRELAGGLELLAYLSGSGDNASREDLAAATGHVSTPLYNRLYGAVMDQIDFAHKDQKEHAGRRTIAMRSTVPNKDEALEKLATVRMFLVSDPEMPTGVRLEIAKGGTADARVSQGQDSNRAVSPEEHVKWMTARVLNAAGCHAPVSILRLANPQDEMGQLARAIAGVSESVASQGRAASPRKAELSTKEIAGWMGDVDEACQQWKSTTGSLPFLADGVDRPSRSPLSFMRRARTGSPLIPGIEPSQLTQSIEVATNRDPGLGL